MDMRKRIAAGLAAALALSFSAGCQPKETVYENALERVLGTGKLVMATNPEWAPFEFENLNAGEGEDKYVGCDIALGKYIAEQLGVELEIMPLSFETVIETVVQGQADVGISGLAYRPERAESTMMAGPYALDEGYQGALVRKGMEAEINSIEALNGRKVAVQISSLQFEYAEKYLPDSEYGLISSPIDGVLSLQTGEVDGFLTASSVGEGFMRNYDDIVMSELRFPATEGCYVILKPGEDELFERVQAIVTEAESSGKFAAWRVEAEALAESLGVS